MLTPDYDNILNEAIHNGKNLDLLNKIPNTGYSSATEISNVSLSWPSEWPFNIIYVIQDSTRNRCWFDAMQYCMHAMDCIIASLASILINLLHALMYYDLNSVWELTLDTELWLLLMMVPCIRSGLDPGEFLLNPVDGARTEMRLLLAVISLTDGALGLWILLICSTPHHTHDAPSLSSQT